jgi:uncharacterized SAM-binding protein YcdF (DUF218 family)
MSYKPFQVQMMFGATQRRQSWLRRHWWHLLVGLAGVYVLATLWIAFSGASDDAAKSDVGLVLGTRVELDGQPSLAMRLRCSHAAKLCREGMFKHIIVSGGVGKEGFDEAKVMHDYLLTQGISDEQIIMDNKGDNTYLSAQHTRDIMKQRGFSSVVAVSQYYHMPRARLALNRFHVGTVHTSHAQYVGWRDLYACPRETLAYLAYLLRWYS